jgi:hypothetical protein
LDVCKKITPKTSCDASGFAQKVVLGDMDIMAPMIAHLVNCSQASGICPDNSKIARVVPVYKNKGNKHQYENYRPISLLPVFSKIMEKLIYNKVFDFLVRYEILFKSQYGFRTGHNTTHATLDFLQTIEQAFENDEIAVGIFCDLSKAFDTLNHNILIRKLEHYGIRDNASSWFKSYLSNRAQFVDWNGCKSTKLPITVGVPQGSILGPLLFFIYINDLPAAAEKIKCVIFADDSNLLVKGETLQAIESILNSELENVNDFFKSNKLKLNAKKTKMVCFRKKKKIVDLDTPEIMLDGTKLKFEEEASFLGINLDCHLTWEGHCNKVANKISKNSSVINRVKKMLPPQSLKMLYNSLILTHIQYGLALWGGRNNQNRKRINIIQKRIIRTISKSHIKSHTEPKMKSLGILKIDDLYKQKCATLIHDALHENCPKTIMNFINLTAEKDEHALRNKEKDPMCLQVPNLKTKQGKGSFQVNGPVTWNNLPNNLKEIVKRELFKKHVKIYLIDQYNDNVSCTNPLCRDRGHHSQ